MAYISDSTDFSTVNASANTLIATPLPQSAVDFYYPSMVVNTWYRYYQSKSLVDEVSGNLVVDGSSVGEQNGIIQRLSNLVVGSIYDINFEYADTITGTPTLSIFSGTTLQSSHILLDSTETIKFKASSTEDTIVIDCLESMLIVASISIATPQATVPYIRGLTVKPLSVSGIGVVTFTDGTNEVTPNQLQCEAYGYTYDRTSGTCSAFRYNTNLNSNFSNIKNKTYGARNTTETGTNNTLIMGENNTARSLTRNNVITGSNNEISNGVNNVSLSGTFGEATADNSIVLGGNAGADSLGKRQSIQLMYGVQTTDGSNTSSFLNNTTDSYLSIPDNTVMYFHADVVAVRVGGTHASGAAGDCASWVERGVVINKSGVLSISRERDTIKSIGTVTNWQPTGVISGTDFIMRVRGHADMTIEWCSNITFTQIKTGVTL